MSRLDPHTITQLLRDAQSGDSGAVESLLPLVYDELRAMAVPIFSDQRRGHTLQPTAVIHEAWLKLADHVDRIEDRTHFFAVASQAMRQVLTDHARGRQRQKRASEAARVSLDISLVPAKPNGLDLVDLDDSLTRLAALKPRHARVVELRVLGGLTIAETAEFLGVGHSTVEDDWFMAKAWLRTELSVPDAPRE